MISAVRKACKSEVIMIVHKNHLTVVGVLKNCHYRTNQDDNKDADSSEFIYTFYDLFFISLKIIEILDIKISETNYCLDSQIALFKKYLMKIVIL